jgi:hypothetical protein
MALGHRQGRRHDVVDQKRLSLLVRPRERPLKGGSGRVERRQSSHFETVALGIIQQPGLDGRRGSFMRWRWSELTIASMEALAFRLRSLRRQLVPGRLRRAHGSDDRFHLTENVGRGSGHSGQSGPRFSFPRRLSHKCHALCAEHNWRRSRSDAEGLLTGVGCETSDISRFHIQRRSRRHPRCDRATNAPAPDGFTRHPLEGADIAGADVTASNGR